MPRPNASKLPSRKRRSVFRRQAAFAVLDSGIYGLKKPSFVTQEEIADLSDADLAEIGEATTIEMGAILLESGLRLLSVVVATTQRVGERSGLVFSYKRTADTGPVIAQIIQIPRELDSLRINLATREKEQVLWEQGTPNSDFVILTFEGDSPEESSAKNKENMPLDFAEFTKEVHGLDVNAPLPALPKMVYDSKA